MKLYRVQFIVFDAECERKATLMMVMVEAPCHVEAYVSAAHTYRLACPESLKNMDPSMYIEEVSNAEDIWDE